MQTEKQEKKYMVKFLTGNRGYGAGEFASFSKEWADAYVHAGVAEHAGHPKPRDRSKDNGSSGGVTARPFSEIEMRSLMTENAKMKKQIDEMAEDIAELKKKK